jgi:hypothetical protein
MSAEERGTALELAEALESPVPKVSVSEAVAPDQSKTRVPTWRWTPWHTPAAIVLSGLFLLGLQAVVQHLPEVLVSCGQQSSSSSKPKTGTSGVGSPPAPQRRARPPSKNKPLAQDVPAPLRPQQTRPNEKGKCPGRGQAAFNGACWVEQPSLTAEQCTNNGYALFKGKCFAPAFDPPQKSVPTSSPAEPR